MNGSCKHSSLLHYGNNYGSKKFYSTGTGYPVQQRAFFQISIFIFIFTSFLLWKYCQSKSLQLLNLQLFCILCQINVHKMIEGFKWAEFLLETWNYDKKIKGSVTKGRILSSVRPFYEQVVSDLDRSMHRSLWV